MSIFTRDESDIFSRHTNLPPTRQRDEAFQAIVTARLAEEFNEFRIIRDQTWQVPAGLSLRHNKHAIRPDLVVLSHFSGHDEDACELVADAKDRQRLELRDVEKVADYAVALNAKQGCRIYVPGSCVIASGAQDFEHPAFEVEIVALHDFTLEDLEMV